MENTKLKAGTIKYKSYEEFYSSIDEKGSLGLLAMGAHGVLTWKKKKAEIKAKRTKGTSDDK